MRTILEEPEQPFKGYPDYSSLVSSKTGKGRHAITNRVCSLCGSDKTTETRRFGKHGQIWIGYDWRKSIDGDILCKTCYSKLRYPERREYYKKIANPRTHAKWSGRRYHYKGKAMYSDEIPRTGTCSKCGRSVSSGEIKRTNLHHMYYEDSRPQDHTIELCIACHRGEHNRWLD